jgi:imidazolonepropionase-like amidohydrolase
VRRRAWLVLGLAAVAVACATHKEPTPGPTGVALAVVALVGGRVQPTPEAAPIEDGVILIERGAITAVGPRSTVRIPTGARVLECAGATVSAGFWNSHVHFTQPVWEAAESAPAERLSGGLRAMLTSYGFVRVVDTGSFPPNTQALRRRIDSGEVHGPAILTAGGSFVPAGGSPFYVRPLQLPELTTPAAADPAVEVAVAAGADAIKLFTGSLAEPRRIVVMPVEIVRAAVDAAHRRNRVVISHPSNTAGARAAIEGGVDVLAHTFPGDLDGWDRALPGQMRERQMALIPTLKLWPYEGGRFNIPPATVERMLASGQAQLRAFAELGGQVLFGTDVGYMADYDPTDEYVYLQRAGLSYAQILAALTTAPAARFGQAARTGRLAAGLDADVTVVEDDPARDIRALARVRYALRGGRVIFERPR